MENKVGKFIGEVQSELKKVTWPTREELQAATGVTILITGLLGLYIGVVDFFVSRIITFLVRL